MKILKANIGPINLKLAKLQSFIDTHLSSELTSFLEDDILNVQSVEHNIRFMEKGDPRIKELQRTYLISNFLNKKQFETFKNLCKKNNISLQFKNFPISDKKQSELQGENV